MRIGVMHGKRQRQPAAGVVGPLRFDRDTAALLRRLHPGDIAVIDHVDLDRASAEALLARRVAAVVNVTSSISGRYPTLGPGVLVDGGVPLVDDLGRQLFGAVRDGDQARLLEETLYARNGAVLGTGIRQTVESVTAAVADARAGLSRQLEAFTASSAEYLRREHQLLLEGAGVPPVRTRFRSRPTLVVSTGRSHRAELVALQTWIREQRPALVGVDNAADTLRQLGHRPDVIVGELTGVSDATLRCGAELVVLVPPDGRSAGRERALDLGCEAVPFHCAGTPTDAALLLAAAGQAEPVVTVGAAASLDELLDSAPTAAASMFLTRLRLGDRVIDGRSVRLLVGRRRARVGPLTVAAVLAASLAAGVVAPLSLLDRSRPTGERPAAPRVAAGQPAAATSLIRQLGAALIAGRLAGQRVLLVTTPGLPAGVEQEVVNLLQAGAAVPDGVVQLTPTYLSPSQDGLLSAVATRLAGAAGLPAGSGADQAAAQLAGVLVPAAHRPAVGQELTTVLSTYQAGGLLTITGSPQPTPEVILLVGRTSVATATAGQDVTELTAALRARGAATVLAGPDAAPGTPVALVRGGAAPAGVVTVDDLNLAQGQLAVALALAPDATGPGRYGTLPGESALPQLAR